MIDIVKKPSDGMLQTPGMLRLGLVVACWGVCEEKKTAETQRARRWWWVKLVMLTVLYISLP